ncbi:MAG: hypothetical protein JNJ86_11005 [Chitinophagaceae bacterium]|jgi:hypothetical protein|nr:hypothetical protein [Chitinophagaceae bacterium]
MKRSAVVLWVLVSSFAASSLKAQFYYYNDRYYDSPLAFEIGGSAGLMNSLTDLGGKKGIGKSFIKDLNWKNAKPSFSVYALAMYKYAVGVRLEGTFGSVQAADSSLRSVATSTFGRYERNLSFKSKITDVQLALEIHPLFFRDYDENEAPYFSPYLVAGVGYFSFDPQAEINGQVYSLQPLRTEGQGFAEYRDRTPYKLSQVNFPVGIGIRYEVNSFLNARVEVLHRILQTDYLDDVSKDYVDPALFSSYLPANQAAIAQQLFDRQGELNGSHTTQVGSQRGNPKNNDAYFTVQVKLGITLGRLRR